jgi:hypothetical protein
MLGFDADGDPVMSDSSIAEVDGAVDIISSSTTILTNVVSVAALRLLGSAITDNDSITVLGYYAEGDGGGGTFFWDALSTATDNGGTIIKATSVTTGRWVRLYSGKINAEWFGVSSTGLAAANTTALHAAMAFVSAQGGGTITIPPKQYTISEVTFNGTTSVTLEGVLPESNYGNPKSVSSFLCTTGVFAFRAGDASSYAGLKNLAIVSNGVLDGTNAPHVISTNGVEYGVLLETGSTIMDSVNISGFQYGCVLARGGNSNIFERCGFNWNTKVGFACTYGTAAAYAVLHPNLTHPGTDLSTTTYTMNNCISRRNAWGFIFRNGDGHFTNVMAESNFFGGMMFYEGSVDSSPGGTFDDCYFEGNWPEYTDSVAYTITQNNLLKETASTWMDWTLTPGVTATNDPGYQIYMMSKTAGTLEGANWVKFNHFSMSLAGAAQKGLYIKSAHIINITRGSCTGGDQPNAVRLGDGSYNATAVHFDNFNGTLPSTLSNRGMSVISERVLPYGGLTAEIGYYRGLAPDTGTFVPVIGTGWTGTVASITGNYTTIRGWMIVEILVIPDSTFSAAASATITGLPETELRDSPGIWGLSPAANQGGFTQAVGTTVYMVTAVSTTSSAVTIQISYPI